MLQTFTRGGVHPPENKLSAGSKIINLPLPLVAYVPISQHIGSPAKAIVEKGDKVKVGQLIATANGFISANVHAPVSGTVAKIDEMLDISGYSRPVIVINTEGDEWLDDIDTSDTLNDNITATGSQIVQKVLEAGIVGLGGAAFPAHVKLQIPNNKKVDCLIINGVECEPFLTSDHALMLQHAPEILVGIKLLMIALQVDKAIIGIENNKTDAIKLLSQLAKQHKGITVQALKVKYPQGGEKQLISALLKRDIPAGKLPIEVGAVVFNIGSTFALYQAVQKNRPLIDRIVTLTGLNVLKPANYRVRVGTPITNLFEASGGLPSNTSKIVHGGPMMGKAIVSINMPVIKGTSGVLCIPQNEAARREEQNCCRCARCVDACPMHLEPYLLMPLSKNNRFDKAEYHNIMDCMECGSCAYICPSSRPLVDYIRYGKSNVLKLKNKK